MVPRPHLALPLAALLAACAGSKPPPTTPPGVPTRSAVSMDLAQLEALAADQAFSSATEAHDPGAFAAFLARDAVFIGQGGVSAGVAAVCADWAPLLTPGGPGLAWAPDAALAAGSGDLVMTRGAFTFRPADGGAARTGRYVTVWQREADGKLRALLDGSDTPLPPEAASAVRRPLRRVLSADQRVGAVAGLLLDGTREVGGFLLVEVREGENWRVLLEVGSWRPDRP